MSRQPSLEEVIVSAFDSKMNNIFTSIPCIVVGVHEDKHGVMVDIQPTINQKFHDGTVKERPPILGVPVQFPVTKSSGLTFPISIGDTGIATFSMRNMDAWKSGNGYPSTPINAGKFDKQDAIFIPGVQPPSVTVNDPARRFWPHNSKDTVLAANIGTGAEVEIRMTSSGTIKISTKDAVKFECKQAEIIATESATITSQSVTIDTDLLQVNGPAEFNDGVTIDGIEFSSHKHTDVSSGPSTTGGPTN